MQQHCSSALFAVYGGLKDLVRRELNNLEKLPAEKATSVRAMLVRALREIEPRMKADLDYLAAVTGYDAEAPDIKTADHAELEYWGSAIDYLWSVVLGELDAGGQLKWHVRAIRDLAPERLSEIKRELDELTAGDPSIEGGVDDPQA